LIFSSPKRNIFDSGILAAAAAFIATGRETG